VREIKSKKYYEKAVLGCILLDPTLLFVAVKFVSITDFSEGLHALIYSIMIDLTAQSKEIDLINICDKLKAKKRKSYVDYVAALVDIPKLSTTKIDSYINRMILENN